MPRLFEKIYVIVAFLILSGAVLPFLRHETGDVDYSAKGDPLNFIIFSLIYGVALLLLFLYRAPIKETDLNSKLLFGLVALAILSAAWSGDPLFTLRRSLALLGTTMFGIYIGLRFSLDEQLRLLAYTLSICAIASLAMALLVPSYGMDIEFYGSAWRGIYEHKNHLGRVMVLSTLVFLFIYARSRSGQCIKWSMVLLSIMLTFFSLSETSLLVLTILIVLFPIFKSFSWNNNLRNFLFALMFALGLCAIWWILYNPGIFMSALGRDSSLTGRTDLWRAVFSAILERPLLGYGYDAFWGGVGGKDAYVLRGAGWLPGTAHSGFLDLLLELGITGAIIFCAHFILALRRAILRINSGTMIAAIWPLTYLTFMVLANLAESPILRQHSLYWILYVAVTTSLSLSNDGATPAIAKHKLLFG
jgi:O-antigen ligase